ncbi:ComEA family DNA-binding protein [Caproicibacter sp.]|uniref:ComEA family DNA-binding protein n=1 Tax=Caproicibacter sp. TaxID=2814884 RepID=UPI00398A26A7
MDEESRQKRLLILLAALICSLMIGYNAFYVPDATVAWRQESSSQSETPALSSRPEPASSDSAVSSGLRSAVSSGLSSTARINGKVNINTATPKELSDGLNGIGKTLSQRIVDYREKNGPFRSIEEIKNVSGIGDKIFEQIRDSITI